MSDELGVQEFTPTAYLKQVVPDGTVVSSYPVLPQQTVAIGRDPSCEVVVDALRFTTVSRRHAEIRPVASDLGQPVRWWICDLNSSNGTFLNGQKLVGCQILQLGDRIILGQQGPEYRFDSVADFTGAGQVFGTAFAPVNSDEIPNAPEPILRSTPFSYTPLPASSHPHSRILPDLNEPDGNEPNWEPDRATMTQLFPIFSTGLDITRKAYILPALVTITTVVSLFLVVGRPELFNGILAIYLALAAYYRIYQLCGKPKAWWVILATGLATVVLLRSPVFLMFVRLFREILPGQLPTNGQPINIINMFFGAGLMEELLKAVPLLGILILGMGRSPRWLDRYGIREPLDGILLGAASAMGFTLFETLVQYVPDVMANMPVLQTGTPIQDLQQTQGLHLLIARLLGSVAGHMAYSGYFGYAIGLCVLKPDRSWLTLLVGLLTASLLHTLWNSVGGLPIVGPFALAAIGLLSYALLAAAILKARTLSPNRDRNFATRLKV